MLLCEQENEKSKGGARCQGRRKNKKNNEKQREGVRVGKSHSWPQVPLPFWSKNKIATAQLVQPTSSFRDAFVMLSWCFCDYNRSPLHSCSKFNPRLLLLRRWLLLPVAGKTWTSHRSQRLGTSAGNWTDWREQTDSSSGRQIPQALKVQAPNMPYQPITVTSRYPVCAQVLRFAFLGYTLRHYDHILGLEPRNAARKTRALEGPLACIKSLNM